MTCIRYVIMKLDRVPEGMWELVPQTIYSARRSITKPVRVLLKFIEDDDNREAIEALVGDATVYDYAGAREVLAGPDWTVREPGP